MFRFYTSCKVQPHGAYAASGLGGAEMDEGGARLSVMMDVATHELSFGPSTTQNTYVLAQAFRAFLAKDDAIIVTNQDHEASQGAWRRLEDTSIIVKEWGLKALPANWILQI